MMSAAVGRGRCHCAGEDRRPDVAQVECGRSDFGKADRRQVHFAGHPGEAAGGDLVDVEAGEAFHFPIPLLRAIIDVIVAERADVISGERTESGAATHTTVGVNPRRAIAPRQRGAGTQAAVELGEEVAVGVVGGGDDPPLDALFVIDTAERLGGVGIS